MRNAGFGRGEWAKYIKAVREAAGLKTGRLAELVGVSRETVWRWENRGQRPENVDVVRRIAEALGLELDEVLWAANLAADAQGPPDVDPRLRGLDPQDAVVRNILSRDVDEETREFMLNRYREILAFRREQDLRELDIIIRRERGAA